MKLHAVRVDAWPPLAWAARCLPGQDTIVVYHGPRVEAGPGWIVEAVWAGDFAAADFDRTDLVYGTGLRCRDDGLHIVGAATGVDRLWFYQDHRAAWAANTLPGLLSVADVQLRQDYYGYADDTATIETRGIFTCVQEFPARPEPLGVAHFQDLLWDGRTFRRLAKPRVPRRFACFSDYEGFLIETAAALGRNLADAGRAHRVHTLATVSRGYDSPAACVVARHAGCRDTATIGNARSLLPRSDDGSTIAAHLDMTCRTYRHVRSAYRHEETLWAATGRAGGLNMTLIDYPRPLCLLFTAPYGDTVWDIRPHDLRNPHGDSDLMLCEFRLFAGVFHCPVPWWGISDADQINALGALPEMRPWSVGGSYDRPVARRLLEEAGVPRELFGNRKLLTASNTPLHWPFTSVCRASLAAWLREHGHFALPDWLVGPTRALATVEDLAWLNGLKRLVGTRRLRPWRRLIGTRLVFHWANDTLQHHYRAALVDGQQPC